MDVGLIFNEVTGKYEPTNSVGAATPLVTEAGTATLTNKTLTAPTLTAVTITGTSTIGSGMTITAPVLSGTATGTYTLGGTPTITAPVLSGSVTGTYTLAGTPTITAPSISAPAISGAAAFTGDTITGVPVSKTISFTEGGAAGTLTGTVEIPAGATLLNIQCMVTVLFGAGTSATLDVGDDDDPDGWFAAINVKATDLVVGEVLDITNAENWGGKQGVYLVAATGRKGRVTAGVDSGVYYGAASEVVGLITTVGTTSTAGRAFMTVTYVVGQVTAATYAAT